MQFFGIDISKWQGNFDLKRAKDEGVQFAILKAGGGDAGLYKDKNFDAYYSKAKTIGLPVGAYFFGAAKDVAGAIKEADKFIDLLSGKQFEYPVYYDVEGKMLDLPKAQLTDIVFTFCERVEKAGYFTGIYSGEWAFNNNMDDTRLKRFTHWVAKWSKIQPVLKNGSTLAMWQYGGETNFIRSNKIAGVVCDQDYCYQDFPTTIKKLGVNGFSKSTEVPAEPKVAPVVPVTPAPIVDNSFKVRVSVSCLNVRSGPGTNYQRLRFSGIGTFTITEVKKGQGSKKGWGRLGKKDEWISLDYAMKL